MDKKDKFEVKTHFLMAICGGFLGGYAIFSRMAVFGSAQTANLIELVHSILGNDILEMCLRLGALLIYVGAIIIAVYLEKRSKIIRRTSRLSIIWWMNGVCIWNWVMNVSMWSGKRYINVLL